MKRLSRRVEGNERWRNVREHRTLLLKIMSWKCNAWKFHFPFFLTCSCLQLVFWKGSCFERIDCLWQTEQSRSILWTLKFPYNKYKSTNICISDRGHILTNNEENSRKILFPLSTEMTRKKFELPKRNSTDNSVCARHQEFERISRKNIIILADGDCGSIIDSKWLSSSNQPSGFEAALSFTLPVTVSDESRSNETQILLSPLLHRKYILRANYASWIIHNDNTIGITMRNWIKK